MAEPPADHTLLPRDGGRESIGQRQHCAAQQRRCKQACRERGRQPLLGALVARGNVSKRGPGDAELDDVGHRQGRCRQRWRPQQHPRTEISEQATGQHANAIESLAPQEQTSRRPLPSTEAVSVPERAVGGQQGQRDQAVGDSCQRTLADAWHEADAIKRCLVVLPDIVSAGTSTRLYTAGRHDGNVPVVKLRHPEGDGSIVPPSGADPPWRRSRVLRDGRRPCRPGIARLQ